MADISTHKFDALCIPCIPPLFNQGKYVTDFKKKRNYLTTSLPNNVP